MKICKLCGEDCSGRPRVKDAAGSYYCKTCHGAAMEQREEREAAALGQADAGFNDGGVDDDEYGVLSEILADAPAAPPPGRQCSGCGAGVAVDAHVCTNCGMNLDSGKKMKVHVMKAASSAGGSGQLWPIIVGIISIVVGVIDVVLHVTLLMSEFEENNSGAVRGSLHLILALALIYGGAKLIMRSPSAITVLKQWSNVKLFLGLTCYGIALAAIAASSEFSDRIAGNAGLEGYEVSQGQMMAILAIEFVWVMAWPVFLAIWLRRAKVEADAGQW